MKTFKVDVLTTRVYIIHNATIEAEDEDIARIQVYKFLIINKERLLFNPKLYIKIDIKEDL